MLDLAITWRTLFVLQTDGVYVRCVQRVRKKSTLASRFLGQFLKKEIDPFRSPEQENCFQRVDPISCFQHIQVGICLKSTSRRRNMAPVSARELGALENFFHVHARDFTFLSLWRRSALKLYFRRTLTRCSRRFFRRRTLQCFRQSDQDTTGKRSEVLRSIYAALKPALRDS